jgi:hypothetical protein
MKVEYDHIYSWAHYDRTTITVRYDLRTWQKVFALYHEVIEIYLLRRDYELSYLWDRLTP